MGLWGLLGRPGGVLGVLGRVWGFLYADDLVLAADSTSDLQAALDAASRWADRWRLSFGVGPSKSAVLPIRPHGARASRQRYAFHLGAEALPVVTEYRYLGVWFGRGGVGREHARILHTRGLSCCGSSAAWAAAACGSSASSATSGR